MSNADTANLRRMAEERDGKDPLAAMALAGAADEIDRLRGAPRPAGDVREALAKALHMEGMRLALARDVAGVILASGLVVGRREGSPEPERASLTYHHRLPADHKKATCDD